MLLVWREVSSSPQMCRPAALSGLCSVPGNRVDRDPSCTMTLASKVGEIPLMVLIDSGVSHNFILQEVVSGLGLRVDTTNQMGVRLGDGHRIKTQGRCSNIQVQLGDLGIIVEADIMELRGVYLIPGIKWLETLGKVIMDWKEITMSFVKDGKKIKLRSSERDQRNEDKFLESDALRSIVGKRMQVIDGLLWTVVQGEQGNVTSKLTIRQQRELKVLLEKYSEVFRELDGIPPLRDMTHSIVLQPAPQLVSVRPYRYLQYQKDEIEKHVQKC